MDSTESDTTWYDMYLSIGSRDIEQNPHHSELFEACVIRRVSGSLVDDDGWSFFIPQNSRELDLTGRALVGLNIKEVDWIQWSDPISTDELEELYFKLKIYACDDLEGEYPNGG